MLFESLSSWGQPQSQLYLHWTSVAGKDSKPVTQYLSFYIETQPFIEKAKNQAILICYTWEGRKDNKGQKLN